MGSCHLVGSFKKLDQFQLIKLKKLKKGNDQETWIIIILTLKYASLLNPSL